MVGVSGSLYDSFQLEAVSRHFLHRTHERFAFPAIPKDLEVSLQFCLTLNLQQIIHTVSNLMQLLCLRFRFIFLLPLLPSIKLLLVKVPIFLSLLHFLLQSCLVPTPNFRQVLSVPFLPLVEGLLDLCQVLLHFLLRVGLPSLHVIETDGHAHLVVPASAANAVPEGVVVLCVEEDDQV
jgi:hypothetical protein